MEFDDVKPGMVLTVNSDKRGERYWVVYSKGSNAFHTYHYNLEDKDKGVTKVHVPEEYFKDFNYMWEKAEFVSKLQMRIITKILIREIFRYGIS